LIGHVIGADHIGDVGGGEVAIDLVELEDLLIGHVRFGQQHVHMARHAPGDRMDRIADPDPVPLQQVGHLFERVLRLRHGHAVAGTTTTEPAFLRMKVASSALPDLTERSPASAPAATVLPSVPNPRRITSKIERFIPLHDVTEDRARRADERAGDDQQAARQGKPDAADGPNPSASSASR
jgi:hypothetical protein